ncbi:universal stress protein [Streptomyces sp. NPDC050546]|uniref:universal stress protein n=1 Tax=Streptomyces sp. NPDC050546 TaxID=3365628 RepID=UPI00378C35CB
MTIVISYSPSPSGEAALAAGITEAQLRGTDAVIVNVSHGNIDSGRKVATPAQLAAAQQRAADAGVAVTTTQPDDALPHYAITRTVQEIDAELLVIGLRKRSAVGKIVTGSLARELLLNPPCDIYAVRM